MATKYPKLRSSIPAGYASRPGAPVTTARLNKSTLNDWRRRQFVTQNKRREYVLTETGARVLGYKRRFPTFIESIINVFNRPANP